MCENIFPLRFVKTQVFHMTHKEVKCVRYQQCGGSLHVLGKRKERMEKKVVQGKNQVEKKQLRCGAKQ